MNNKFIFSIILLAFVVLSVTNVLADPSFSVTCTASPTRDIFQNESKIISCNMTNTGDSNLTLASARLLVPSFGINESIYSGPLAVNSSIPTLYSKTIWTNYTTNIGPHGLSISASGTNDTANATVTQSLPSFNVIYPYCENITGTDDPIDFIEITNDKDIDGEEFKPLDEINIKVKVENNDDDDDDHKVIVTAVLVGTDNEEVDDTEVKEKMKVEADDKKTITLSMKIPADIKEGTYYLYVKVENNDDSDNCEQLGMDDLEVLSIKIEKSNREVIYVEPSEEQNVSCGSDLLVEGDIYNIGNDDEDKIKVVYSDKFGNTQTEEYNDLDSGENIPLSWAFKIPRNATEGKYAYTIAIFYDYDEDDETYDEKESFSTQFRVYGGCQSLIANQTITTEASTAILGIESEVRVKIVNTGTISQIFSITASADWADINSITPSSVTLSAGEEKEIILKIEPKAGTEIGAHDLIVNVQHGGGTDSKTVSVNVQKSSVKSGLIEQLQFQLKYNPAWVVIDAVLVIAIIVVVILLFSGKKA